MEDLGSVAPSGVGTRDVESQEAARGEAAWALVHRAVADVATARGVRALLRSSDGDFRITADRVDGELVLIIEARRGQPSIDGSDDVGEAGPDLG